MKILVLMPMFCLASCANYSGPRVDFTFGYNGATVSATLYGKPPVAPAPEVAIPPIEVTK